jgi:hypothetical protein
MICTIIIWCIVAVCAASIGRFILKLLGAELAFDNGIDRTVIAVWIGLGSTAVFCEMVALFTAVTPATGVVVLVAGAMLNGRWRRCPEFPKVSVWTAGLCTVIVLGFAWHASTVTIDAYDTGLYHQQAVSWISQYGFVRGLAWLHFRLGFTSSWFALAAVFNHGVLAGRVSPLSDGFVTTVCLLHWILTIDRVISRRARLADWYLLFAYSPLIGAAWVWHYDVSLSPDLPAWVITVLTVWVALLLRSRNCAPRALCTPFLMAALGCSFKLSLLPLLPLAFIFPAFAGDTFSLRRLNVKVAAICCLPLLIMAMANVITSGCPLYPSPAGCIGTRWAVPATFAQFVMTDTRDFARKSDFGVRGSKTGIAWLRSWAYRRDKLVLLLLAVAGGVSLLVIGVGDRSRFHLWVLGTGVSGLALMFWSAPNPRFALGFFILLPATALASMLGEGKPGVPVIRVPTLSCLVVVLLVVVLANDAKTRGASLYAARLNFLLPEQIASTEGVPIHIFNRTGDRWTQLRARVQTNRNVRFLSPVSSEQCWNLPLPCTPTLIDPAFQLSPNGLAGGFEKR